MKGNKKEILTPTEFYKLRRPEYFSDSQTIFDVELPKEVLTLELKNITINQKENDFESLCRKLAEKLISPNLIPQVGPTGGGDGKTDSETYPVSTKISERWFVPENGWDKDEKWAFAFSAKEKRKSKAKSDIKNIVGTGRGYSKIFFITNQLPSSKKKKEAQDEFKKEFNVDVVILDGKWIIEKIYSNNLIDLVVDTLNMTQAYKNKKTILGKNDSVRIKRLEEIENNINNPNRYFDYDFQLFEDALEAAIISRMIEKPRDEVEGKFNRAEKFCKKLNFDKQWIRLHYQRAWTYINYYDDYKLFIEEYKKFKNYILKTESITDIELFINLYNLLKGLTATINLNDYQIDILSEKAELLKILNLFENNNEKPCSALISKTYKNQIDLTECILFEKNSSKYLNELTDIIDKCQGMIDYPFESFKTTIEELGNYFYNEKEFDELIDKIASVSEKRNSELSAGEIFIKRGGQKLKNKNYKDAIIYLGKAVLKLSKDESKKGMYLVLIGLGHAYSELGLIWASNNCYVSAAYISFKTWFESGKITKQALNCVRQLTINELLIGRIPNFITWYELYLILIRQVNETCFKTDISDEILFDGCLTIRLLNTDYKETSKQYFLPDLFENQGLFMSRNCILYILGYTDQILKEWSSSGFESEKNLDDFFLKGANQPFNNQMLYKTNFITEEKITFTSKILGCEFIFIINKNIEMILVAETLLAFFESFLATSLEGVYPKSENITINIIENKNNKTIEFNKNDFNYNFIIKDFNVSKIDINYIWNKIGEFTINLIINNFIIKKPIEYFKNLFEKEELNEKLSLIFHHRNFIFYVLGNETKFILDNWIDKVNFKKYPLLRNKPLNLNISKEKKKEFFKEGFNLDNVRHDKRKVFSLINEELWDKALWTGFGIIDHPIYGFNLMLCFEEGEYGKKIFDEWIKKIGSDDKDDIIRLSIIRGINKKNPHWFRVHISYNIDKTENGNLFFVLSRIHEMNASDSSNIEYAIRVFKEKKEYKIIPAKFVKENNSFMPFFDKFIKKRELNILYAWEIGEHDLECVVIKDDDVPFIPNDITDAPVLKILKKIKKEKKDDNK